MRTRTRRNNSLSILFHIPIPHIPYANCNEINNLNLPSLLIKGSEYLLLPAVHGCYHNQTAGLFFLIYLLIYLLPFDEWTNRTTHLTFLSLGGGKLSTVARILTLEMLSQEWLILLVPDVPCVRMNAFYQFLMADFSPLDSWHSARPGVESQMTVKVCK